MTTTTATMMYAPSTSVADASASTIVLRRGNSATPLFLHRTPVYQVRSTASMSYLPTSRPSTAPALSMSSASAAQYPPSASTAGRILVSSVQPPLAHNQSPTVPTVSFPHLRQVSSPRASFSRQSHIVPAARPPPPNKALPPIPFPSGPPTPPEDTSAAPEFFAAVTPSRSPAARPVSQDTEDTIRELEQLAASLKQMSASTTSVGVLGACRDRDLSPVKISVTVPNTPMRRAQRQGHAGDDVSCASLRSATGSSVVEPRIVVTNASMDVLPSLGLLNSVPVSEHQVIARKAAIGGVSWKGEDPDAEEMLWVDEYGAWGASEKGKWKAIGEAEDDTGSEQWQDAPSRAEAACARPSLVESSYIYEPVGAPEFLIGSSTSRDARAGMGYRSRRATMRATGASTPRPRRPRPAPLVLANPVGAELALATALLLGTPRKRPSTRRPQTTPHTPRTPRGPRARMPTPPSASLPKRQQASDGSDGTSSHAVEPSIAPATAPTVTEYARVDVDDSNRHSEPLPAMPRVPSSAIHVLRGKFEHAHARPMTAPSVPGGSHSEPNSPRPAVRPRLKSLKSLFKHWSK